MGNTKESVVTSISQAVGTLNIAEQRWVGDMPQGYLLVLAVALMCASRRSTDVCQTTIEDGGNQGKSLLNRIQRSFH